MPVAFPHGRRLVLWLRGHLRSNISLHPTVLSPLRGAKTAAELHR